MKKSLFSILFYLFFFVSNAQYFQTGQDPASIKWRRINTENFELIYPDYYELQAQKLAYVLEKVYNYGSYSLKYNPRKISVILHTQTVSSNGLVAYAPKRAEFYTTPNQGIYPQDWLEQLALHEFRHVVQVDKIDKELPGIIKAILGEQGTALVFGAYLPWWFIEGDAVVTETALSNYGRGRFPSFLMEHQAQVIEKGVYSYDKAYNGSYKNYVPNHYQLGYYLVGNARQRYGSDLWEKVISNVGAKPFSLRPFNSALKKNTGFNKVSLYKSVFDSLKNVWQAEDANFKTAPFQKISAKNRFYTSYNYNYYLNDSTIISYKTSINKIPAFVEISKNGKEKKIFTPGLIFDESVNYRDNLIVWSEQIPDPRWSHSGKSLIRIFNIDSGEITDIQPEFKSFSPSISEDKKRVAVVETDFSNNYYVSVYSMPEGKLLNRFQTEKNNYFFSPEWLNANELAVVLLFENGKRLAKINPATGKYEILINSDLGDLKQIKRAGENLLFISSYSGKNGLYLFNLEKKELQFLFEPRFGADSPESSPNSKNIVLSDYTADGFQLIEIKRDEIKNKPMNEVKRGTYSLAENLAKQEKGIPDFSEEETSHYSSEKYSKPAHLLNFHSWAPVFIDVQAYEIVPGASIMSQNKLGSAETILGYKYDVNEKSGKFYAGYTFKGWYPVFRFEISNGNRKSKYYEIQKTVTQSGEVIKQDTLLKSYSWNMTSALTNVSVPFNLTKGAFNRLLQPEFQYEFNYYGHNETTPDEFFEGSLQSFSYRLYYHQLLKQSAQDVYPDFGFIVDANFQHSPTGTADLGNIAVAQSVVYLPGLMKNHGISIYSGIQKKEPGEKYGFGEAIRYPRGWGKVNTTEMYSMAVDYKLPLFYPEWSVGGLVYVQRVKASIFGDYAQLQGNIYDNGNIVGRYKKNINSFGAEITGDVNFLRFYAPANIGVRASYLPETQNIYFDFLFSIDLTSL